MTSIRSRPPVPTDEHEIEIEIATISRDERSRRTHDLLQRAAAADDDAERDALLERVVVLNCRVADAVAARYRDRGVPLEDLVQAAYEGLVKAVRRYDPAHADDLLTFAVPTMRGEVQRHFRDKSWMVRPPRRLQDLQARATVAAADLREELGREPADREICCRLGIGTTEYAEMVAAWGCFTPVSLDREVGGDGSATIGDLICADDTTYDAAEARCMVEPAVRRLAPRDQRVLYLRFHEERSQQEIATELGLSSSQVGRMLDRLLRTLRWAVDPERADPADTERRRSA